MKKIFTLSLMTLTLIAASGCTLIVSSHPPVAPTAVPIGQVSGPYAALTPPPLPPTSIPTATSSPTPVHPTPTAIPPTGTPSPTPTGLPSPSPTVPLSITQVISDTATPGPEPTEEQVVTTPTLTATGPATPTSMPEATATRAITNSAPAASQSSQISSQNSTWPTVRETTLTINTYDYQSALAPTTPEDPVYPYPRLNHDQVGPPSAKNYLAIILENQYTRLTILPELGGRIYRWVDKTSGKNLFYENPVIKPTRWGYRGWWLATGGMEWALPTDEHGLSEASPWGYNLYQADGLAGVVLVDTDENSGLNSEINVSLDAQHAYFTLAPRIVNPTNRPISYKFWINGMFGLGSPYPKSGIEFVLPGNKVTIHSTGDSSLPGERQVVDWPVFNGRDFSDYGNWNNYLGVFAAPAAQEGFMGAYNHDTKLGVVRVFPHLLARGAKIFGPGDLDPALWTTDGSRYFELWGGLAPTFWDEVSLSAGEWITWQERWYAIGDMGGYKVANEEAALNLGALDTSVQVAAASTYPLSGELVLWQGGHEATRWPVLLAPEHPFRGSFATTSGNSVKWGLTLYDQTGREVASLGQTQIATANTPPPAAIPAAMGRSTATATPTLTPAPVLPTPLPTATPTGLPANHPSNQPAGWDTRLDNLDIELSRAQGQPGQTVFRLVNARYLDEFEAHGLHHVFVEVLDENGRRILGQPVKLKWKDGESTMITEDKPYPEFAANAPLYGEISEGSYDVFVDGAPSDVVSGLGLPGKHHVSYQLTFQRGGAGARAPPPPPTPPPPH
ncbi:MAG: DUF5107 domain-containing protein, partial [Chloroflexota bacterium]